MKMFVGNKVYDTDSSYLMKSAVKLEDLGNGYYRETTMRIYFRQRKQDYYLYINQTATDPKANVIDTQDYIYPCSEEFAQKFNRSYDYLDGTP